MKKRSLLLVSLGLSAGAAFGAEPVSWQFLKEAGGMAMGQPAAANGAWLLPVRCDVSGMQPITNQPVAFNANVVCEGVNARVDADSIYLTVVTGPLRKGFGTICPPAKLGDLKPGRYRVYYAGPSGEPAKLGKIVIPETPGVD